MKSAAVLRSTSSPSWVRSLATGVAVAAGVTCFKLVLGDSIGEEAPFAFFGVAITIAGWIGGARVAFLLTPVLTFVWWYLLDSRAAFALSAPLLLLEGATISAVLLRIEQTRNALQIARDGAERFRQLTAALAVARTPAEVATAMVTHGVAALGAVAGSVIERSGANQLRLVAQQGLPENVARYFQSFPLSARVPTAEAFRTGDAIWLEQPASIAGYADVTTEAAASVTGAVVALPLKTSHGEVFGVAAFRFGAPRQFTAEDRALLLTFAALCGQAFERAQLYLDELVARRRLATLEQLSSSLSMALTREDVARVVVEQGVKAATADICTLYALDGNGVLLLIGERGVSPDVRALIQRIEKGDGNPSYATLESGEPLWVEDEQGYREFSPELATMAARGPRAKAFWAVPLIAEGKALGLLGMGFFEPRRFPKEERIFVETFARHCAEALRRSERLESERRARSLADRLQSSLATTLRSIGEAVIATDARGLVTFMNPVAETLTGWSDAEARGQHLGSVFRILSEASRQEVESPVETVLRDGAIVRLANPALLLSRDGSRAIPIDDSGAPIRNPDGEIEGVVLVFRDVSSRRRDEARLIFLAETMRALGESLDFTQTLARVADLAVPQIADWVAVDVLDGDTGVVKRLAVAHVDPAKVKLARELYAKYPPDPNAERGIYKVLRGGRAELYPAITDEMLRAGARDDEHLRISRQLGLRSAMVVPLTARGHTLGAITFVAAESGHHYTEDDLSFAEDVASRCALAIDNARLFSGEREARNSADLANRAKDEFLAKVSHELRTPLNAIMGWAQLLASRGLEPAKQERGVETIQRNSVAMARLIDDLLDVSRIISGKMGIELQPMDLPRAVEAALESVRPMSEAKNIDVHYTLEAGVPPVQGDPARIQQTVWNLLSNALKFTAAGGRVEVTVSTEPGSIVVSVSDNGKGIEPAFLPYVFDAFLQEESGHTRSRGGLGLGLAIVKQLVDLHGGRIEAHSDGVGHGARFVMSLPLMPEKSVEEAAKLPPPPAPTRGPEVPDILRGLHILVIDDDDDARTLVRAVLERHGSRVSTAGSASEGLALFDQQTPDVLISDIGMPGQDGYDVIRSIRALPSARGGAVPAAALTAFARAEDRRRLINAGFSIHITKPFEAAELVAVVANLGRAARSAQMSA